MAPTDQKKIYAWKRIFDWLTFPCKTILKNHGDNQSGVTILHFPWKFGMEGCDVVLDMMGQNSKVVIGSHNRRSNKSAAGWV